MVQDGERVGSVKQQILQLFKGSLATVVPNESDVEPLIAMCNNAKFGDYQW